MLLSLGMPLHKDKKTSEAINGENRLNADTAEDYTQPFYVKIGRGRVNLHTGIRGGYYLPALEPKEEEEVKLVETIVRHIYVNDIASRRQVAKIYQLEHKANLLEKNLNEHIEMHKAKKKEGKFTTYK